MMVLSLEFSQTVPHIYLHWTPTESPDSRRIWQENSAIKNSLNQSVTDDLAYKLPKKFHNIDDREGKLNFCDRN